MYRFVITSCLFLVVSSLGCRTVSSNSEIKHDLRSPVLNGAFDYIDLHSDEALRTITRYLPLDHELNHYLQGWFDHFDETLRLHYPQQMKNIPRPRSILRRDPSAAAAIGGVRHVCYEASLIISPTVAIQPSNQLEAISISHGRLSPVSASNCQKIPVESSRFAEFAAWSAKRFGECSLRFVPSAPEAEQLVIQGSCREEDFFPKKSRAQHLTTTAATNWIFVNLGAFIKLENEEQLVALLAHELAHYYRAHAANTDKYGFCYRLQDENPQGRPVPDPSLKELCRRMKSRIDFSPEEALHERLGYYTLEQEADELGLEWMALVGVDPSHAISAWFIIGEDLAKKQGSSYEIPLNECRTLQKNGWRDAQGKEVFIPIGDYRDDHHSWCYRVKNIEKEIAVHPYEVQVRKKEFFSWDDLQQKAKL